MASEFKVLRNTFSQIISRILVVAVSLLTTSILTRTLGVEGFGNYVFITSLVLLFVGLTDFGTTTIAVREASVNNKTKEKEQIFAGVFGLRVLMSFLVFSLFNLMVIVLPQFNEVRQASFFASFVLFFLMLRTTSQSVLQTFLRLDIGSLLEIIASVVMAIFLIVGIFAKVYLSLNLLMLFWVFSSFFTGILSLYFWEKYLLIKISFNWPFLKKIIKQSYPLGLYLLIYAAYDRGIDSFFLKTFSGTKAVGFYGLAYKIHGNLIFGAAFLMNSLFPIISSLKIEDEKISLIFKKAFSILFLAGLIILVVGLTISPLMIKIISGQEFAPAVNILRILLFATLFSFLNHLNGYLLISFNEQKKLLFFSMISLSINLILNLIFIPIYSYWAAAIITVITESTIYFLSQRFLSREYRLKMTTKIFVKNILFLFKEKSAYFNFN